MLRFRDASEVAAEVVCVLTRRGETLATCESLTAGLCAATIASVPGASAVLRGGLITYATDAKAALAGVPVEVLRSAGPVSAETVHAMALGARDMCVSSWAVALSGVAGPDLQDGHPVGEVWIAVDGQGRVGLVRSFRFGGGRQEIREQAVVAALELLLECVEQSTATSDKGMLK